MSRSLLMGCVADDFTGASDAASFLVKGGLRTLLLNGIPDESIRIDDEWQAVVIALKTRTMETAKAVAESAAAAAWLRSRGARLIYEKYCSTFDSTRAGNIGPISDSLLESSGEPYTILCPALPVNKRTVSGGRLYVDGVPLHESSMKDHPLTPMWDCDIGELMRPQSKYPCFKLSREAMDGGDEAVFAAIEEFGRDLHHFYVIPDFTDQSDAERIVRLFGALSLLTGGSGLMETLARKLRGGTADAAAIGASATKGAAIVLAGSCSKATRGQIAHFESNGGASLRLRPLDLWRGAQTIDEIWRFVEGRPNEAVLIYSFEDADSAAETRELGQEKISALLEKTTAAIALRAVRSGRTRLIVAGGETSGAVTKRLGFFAYEIGESVAPGVPIMTPINQREIRLVLKSGNFGAPDFFRKAVDMTGA